jgi:glycosyltransferase involved in cell wall biosynthesis
MNILLVVHQFFPEFSAGTEVLTLGVARELRALGHNVRIFSGHPSASDNAQVGKLTREIYEKFEIYRFHHAYTPMGGQLSMLEIGWDNRLAAHYFRDILAEFEPDRVHYFHLHRLGTGLIVEAENAGIPQSLTPTDFWGFCPTSQLRLPDGRICDGPSRYAGNCAKHFAQNKAIPIQLQATIQHLPTFLADGAVQTAKLLRLRGPSYIRELTVLGELLPKTIFRLNKIQKILAPNSFMRYKLIAYGVDPQRVLEVSYGIDLSQGFVPARMSPPGVPLRIGFIGTLAPHKGAHVLMEAFARLAAGKATLHIYGAGQAFPDYVAHLHQAASKTSGVNLAGTFSSTEIFSVFAGIDVLVVPSLWFENTPLVVYSAQAAGVPVVASNFPGLSCAVRDKVDGLLFTPGNCEELSGLLSELATSPSLLYELRKQVQPPKSTATYTNEILQVCALSESS